MNMTDYEKIGDDQITKYILGQISPEDESEIDLLLADDHFYERFCMIEEDLVDEYARGGLTPEMRLSVERHLLSGSAAPEMRSEVDLSRSLYRLSSQIRADQKLATSISSAGVTPSSTSEIGDRQLIDYLLGRSSVEEVARLDMALVNDQFFDRVVSMEEDLVDDYVTGRGNPSDRLLIEQRLLNDRAGRDKLQESKDLYAAVSLLKSETNTSEDKLSLLDRLASLFTLRMPVLAFGMAAALVITAVGSLWGLYVAWQYRDQSEEIATLKERENRLGSENTQLLADSEMSRREAELLAAELDRLRSARTIDDSSTAELSGRVATAIARAPLSRGVAPAGRGGDPAGTGRTTFPVKRPINLNIPTSAEIATLDIYLPQDGNLNYQIMIRDDSGLDVLTLKGIKPRTDSTNSILKIPFPASLLSEGSYAIEIAGNDPPHTWQFTLQVNRLK
jgi:hypothetical protein